MDTARISLECGGVWCKQEREMACGLGDVVARELFLRMTVAAAGLYAYGSDPQIEN